MLLCVRFFAVMLLSVFALAQQREWASRAEYELAQQATEESDLKQKITLLLQWQTAYPASQFNRERTRALANSYREEGNLNESLVYATRLLEWEPDSHGVLAMIASIGPLLQNPSEQQIATVENAAKRLLASPPQRQRPVTAVPPPPSSQEPDPESLRVDSFLGQMRQGQKQKWPSVEYDQRNRLTAEKALEWVRAVRR